MDPRRLLTFRTVAHERSFSRAAEKLSLSQPSVSHQVALLETEIGVRLLDRGRGGLRLTHAGAVLLEHADHLAWRLRLADTQITDLAEARSGSTCSKRPSSWVCHQSIGSLARPGQFHWRSSPKTIGSCRPQRASSFRHVAMPASIPA